MYDKIKERLKLLIIERCILDNPNSLIRCVRIAQKILFRKVDMKNLTKKIFVIAGLAAALTAVNAPASATSEKHNGGTWEYGYYPWQAYSSFYHLQNSHGSKVVDYYDAKNVDFDNARAGVWSVAQISIPLIGGKAVFRYSYSGGY